MADLECQLKMCARFAILRAHLKLSFEEFARKIDIDLDVLERYETALERMPAHVTTDICDAWPVNMNWLVSGFGTMLRDDTRTMKEALPDHRFSVAYQPKKSNGHKHRDGQRLGAMKRARHAHPEPRTPLEREMRRLEISSVDLAAKTHLSKSLTYGYMCGVYRPNVASIEAIESALALPKGFFDLASWPAPGVSCAPLPKSPAGKLNPPQQQPIPAGAPLRGRKTKSPDRVAPAKAPNGATSRSGKSETPAGVIDHHRPVLSPRELLAEEGIFMEGPCTHQKPYNRAPAPSCASSSSRI